ncbi:MAG: hypothetical protein J6V88_04620 [Kiritimatiellae bacterium]|jgi:hypothetical protein|nr:hypothetical protein [Kiritimatiellia bacterium]
MTPIRKKDKIFLCIILPVILIAGYFYLWKIPASKQIRGMIEMRNSLPDTSMFVFEEKNLKVQKANAIEELEKIKAEKRPERKVKGKPSASPAERQKELFEIFRSHGSKIIQSSPIEQESESISFLKATGIYREFSTLKISFVATYATLIKIINQIESEKKPVIIETLSTTDTAKHTWEALICY